MKLNKEQLKLAENGAMGYAVIRGVAGSGKTSVGVARIPYLLEKYCNGKDKILFVTYNKSLTKYIEYLYEKMEKVQTISLFDETNKEKHVEVKNIDSITMKYFCKWKADKQKELENIWKIPNEIVKEAINNIKDRYPKVKLLNTQNMKFLQDEMNWIQGSNYTSLGAYQEAERIGRTASNVEGPSKLFKNSMSREAVFSLLEEVERLLLKQGKVDGPRANSLALEYIKTQGRHECYKHIIIDEAQDLTKVQLDFISELKEDSPESSILFLMDVAQSIYPHAWLTKGRSFKSIGYDMTGKGYKLTKNYRTTTEISECAYSLLAKEETLVSDYDFVKPSLLERHGEYPVYRHFATSEEQNLYIVRLIRALLKQGYSLKDIAVVSKLNKNLELLQDHLKEKGVESFVFKNNQEESFGAVKVKLLTMHSIKGLEFKVVILADLNSDVIPYPQKGLEEEELKDEEMLERKLLYVGMTRAQEKLFMCSYGTASKFIADINARYLSMQTGSRMNAFYRLPYGDYLFTESIAQANQEEESVRQWVICELMSNYGYPKSLIQLEYPVRNFSQTGKVDVVVMNAKINTPYIFIETKKETVSIEEAIDQLKSYMNVSKVNYGIATNGKNIAFLNDKFERISDIPICNASILPSSIETYKYVDRITLRETVFERDLSALEVYVAEVRQKPEELKRIKVYSDIAAGIPIEIVDEIRGAFDLPRELLRGKESVYILQVKGDSMIEKDILNGDYVVIDSSADVNDQDIAAVYYNGATTLKQVMHMGDSVLLISANPKYEPIHIEEGDLSVMGKLVGVIKQL